MGKVNKPQPFCVVASGPHCTLLPLPEGKAVRELEPNHFFEKPIIGLLVLLAYCCRLDLEDVALSPLRK
jgi:hypothetical protein